MGGELRWNHPVTRGNGVGITRGERPQNPVTDPQTVVAHLFQSTTNVGGEIRIGKHPELPGPRTQHACRQSPSLTSDAQGVKRFMPALPSSLLPSPCATRGVVPLGGDQPSVPAKQGGGSDREDVVPAAGMRGQRGEPEAIRWFVADRALELGAVQGRGGAVPSYHGLAWFQAGRR